jgi:chlorobactene glucosyltransferase
VSAFWIRHQISLLYFLGVLLLIALSNVRWWRRLSTYGVPRSYPRVSVLVPVREEAANVGPCVRSLLAQDYPDLEVLALDDESTDGTAEVLMAMAQSDPRLRVLHGVPLPAGWLGKHWACHQLAQAATGELLLFVDADTRHTPQALAHAVAALQAEQADLVSVFPRQEVGSWAERLVVPIMQWSLSSFLPLGLAYRLHWPRLAAASGQFMLFRRGAYELVGGHAAVRQNAVDDVALTRALGAKGLRWRLLDGNPYVRCRMYRSFRQVYDGFTKNLFALFGYNVPLFLFIWLWLLTMFWEPLVVLALGALGRQVLRPAFPLSLLHPAQLAGLRPAFSAGLAGLAGSVGGQNVILAAWAVVLSLLLWGFTHWRFGFPLYLTFLYPLTVLLTVVIALCSMVLTLAGRATWKGRRLARPQRG